VPAIFQYLPDRYRFVVVRTVPQSLAERVGVPLPQGARAQQAIDVGRRRGIQLKSVGLNPEGDRA